MSNYHEYCLIFKPLATASKLPDGQTIFGAICNIMLHTQGQQSFDNYIESFNQEPLMIHSSMFPLNMLPTISKNIFDINYINKNVLLQDSENQISYLQKMKQYKKITYLSDEVYKKYIIDSKFDLLQDDLINDINVMIEDNCLILKDENFINQTTVQMNTHVKKTGYYCNSIDENSNDLYYDKALYFDHNSRYCIYVKTFLSISELNNIFKYSHLFGFGSRHSVGKNSFELIDIKSIEHQYTDNYRLLLSKACYDESIVLSNSYYQIESKLQRTSNFYLNNRLCNRMNLFKEGSYLNVVKEKEWYGKLLSFIVDDKPLYYYAIGYSL